MPSYLIMQYTFPRARARPVHNRDRNFVDVLKVVSRLPMCAAAADVKLDIVSEINEHTSVPIIRRCVAINSMSRGRKENSDKRRNNETTTTGN